MKHTPENANMKKKHLKKLWRRRRLAFIASLFLRFFVFLLIAAVLLVHRLFMGPSETVGNMLTMTLLETSAMKFVPRIFMRQSDVDAVRKSTQVIEPQAQTNTGLITVSAHLPHSASEGEAMEESIEIIPVSGSTYKGYLMIVKDPSRVFLGVTTPDFSTGGMGVDELCEKYDAVAGINASGFEDVNGRGNGGSPIGMVISEGNILRKSDGKTTIAAFDENNILHVGKFTDEEAVSLNLRDGAGWGPALIVNGVAAEVGSTKTGLNPRSAIGQRADGAVLLLVIDGRHPTSLGAGYTDLIEVMLKNGAVNACNLDGGTSSIMYYEGERISSIENISLSRSLPTAFLVKKEAQ